MIGGLGGPHKRPAEDPSSGPAPKERPPAATGSFYDYSVVIKGQKRPMRTYSPNEINSNMSAILGGRYEEIKVLASGDLLVKRNCSSRYWVPEIPH